MFEMKNEMDETATKKKNEDFLKELDKDCLLYTSPDFYVSFGIYLEIFSFFLNRKARFFCYHPLIHKGNPAPAFAFPAFPMVYL